MQKAIWLGTIHDIYLLRLEMIGLVAGSWAKFEHCAVGAREKCLDVRYLMRCGCHLRANDVPHVLEPFGAEGGW